MGLRSTMLESTATGKRPTIGRDTAEGVTQDPFRTLFTGYPCSYQEQSVTVMDVYGQRNTVTRLVVYFDQDPSLEVNDRVEITEVRTGATDYLNVTGTAQPVARGRIWSVDCERIREPS